LLFVTVKLLELVAVPPGVATRIRPLEAPAGTLNVSLLGELTVKEAAAPLTVTEVVPMNPEPLIVTVVPTGPLDGVNDVICGGAAAVATV
jgi:hypothetical protein